MKEHHNKKKGVVSANQEQKATTTMNTAKEKAIHNLIEQLFDAGSEIAFTAITEYLQDIQKVIAEDETYTAKTWTGTVRPRKNYKYTVSSRFSN